jgi:TPP-dependent indolepyruvate ferredoxin oxidoreductase alpha subunit
MGNGLDSLHDHTIDVSVNNDMKKFHLYINSAQAIEDALGVSYFARSLELLKRVGLNIYIDHLVF